MKEMQIECECVAGGRVSRKVITFPITDEMSKYMKDLFTKRNRAKADSEVDTDDTGFSVEGRNSVKVCISVVDAYEKF